MVSKSNLPIEWNKLVPIPGGLRFPLLPFQLDQRQRSSGDWWGRAFIRTVFTPTIRYSSSMPRYHSLSMRPQKLVLTPGGFRHPALVHHLEPGQGFRVTDNGITIIEDETEAVVKEIIIMGRSEHLPPIGSGWIANAYWNNINSSSISFFSATWMVPNPPRTQSGQTIYLFSGMQYFHREGPAMVQPVLQWSTSDTNPTGEWAVACWYLDPSGVAVSTEFVPVNVGDTLVGTITLLSQLRDLFTYQVEFQGIVGTSLIIPDIPQLLWGIVALEAYNIQGCSDYPDAPRTEFQNITIKTGDTSPSRSWIAENRAADCSQHAVVINGINNPGAEVAIYVGSLPS